MRLVAVLFLAAGCRTPPRPPCACYCAGGDIRQVEHGERGIVREGEGEAGEGGAR